MRRIRHFYTRLAHHWAIPGRSRSAALALLVLSHYPAVLAQTNTNTTVSVSITGVEDELLSNVQGFFTTLSLQ